MNVIKDAKMIGSVVKESKKKSEPVNSDKEAFKDTIRYALSNRSVIVKG